jgi:hypothetical protein
MPWSLKGVFCPDAAIPSLVSDYQVIGFDADSTLVKYKTYKLQMLLIFTLLEELHHEFSDFYPASMAEFDFDELPDLVHKNAVWHV